METRTLTIYFPVINHKEKVVNIGIDMTSIDTNYIYKIEKLYNCRPESVLLHVFNYDNVSYITIKDCQIEIMNGMSILPLKDFIEDDKVELTFDKNFKGKVAVIARPNEVLEELYYD